MSDTFFNSILTQMVKILIPTMWEDKVYFVSDKKYSTFSQNSIYFFLKLYSRETVSVSSFPFHSSCGPLQRVGILII